MLDLGQKVVVVAEDLFGAVAALLMMASGYQARPLTSHCPRPSLKVPWVDPGVQGAELDCGVARARLGSRSKCP